MYQSKLFTKTRKEAPKDEVSKNAQLLIRGGFIHKEMAGVYTMLPLGLRVMKKIENIIREEMDTIDGQEVSMTALQDPELWKKTDRWDDEVVDNWFKTELKGGAKLGLASTHEEPLTNLLKNHVNSYKDLPFYPYQFQVKFRNELRAKSGIMRGREFPMKDMYSYSKNEDEFKEFYEKCAGAYMKIFERAGIGAITYRTLADGGSFTKDFTDEFQTISDAGEDIIYIDEVKKFAINKEVYTDDNIEKFGLDKNSLIEKKAIEVGNIFPLGTKYSAALGLTYKTETGEEKPVVMGSYGIGLSRLMGTIVEVLADERGMVWPESVAPFKVHLLSFGKNEEAQKLYDSLTSTDVEVLYDDRDLNPGEKLGDADLIGIPYRIIVSGKSLEAGGVEFKKRNSSEAEVISMEEVLDRIK